MRLFADECVYSITTKTLRAWGHDVETAQEVGLSGHDDNELLQYAISQSRRSNQVSRTQVNLEEWPTHIIEERIEPEEAAFIGAKQHLRDNTSQKRYLLHHKNKHKRDHITNQCKQGNHQPIHPGCI